MRIEILEKYLLATGQWDGVGEVYCVEPARIHYTIETGGKKFKDRFPKVRVAHFADLRKWETEEAKKNKRRQ